MFLIKSIAFFYAIQYNIRSILKWVQRVLFTCFRKNWGVITVTWYCLAGETAAEILTDAGFTILIGLVVVFSVLLLLTAIFKVFGMIMSSSAKKDSAEEVLPAVSTPVVDLGPIVSSAQVRNGISDEETAVIAAAVAASLPVGTAYTIRKIDRLD